MPALTAVEKIISAHANSTCRAGDIAVVSVDLVMAQDGNAPLVITLLRQELEFPRTFDPNRVVLVIDHCAPSPTEGASNLQKMMRSFASEVGARLFDIGEGISHVVLPEYGYTIPGAIIVGSDSHTVTYGAFNCLGLGLGATDIAVAMATGKTWLRVPETLRVKLAGQLSPAASAKDLSLELLRMLGVDGATYKSIELEGIGLQTLTMDNRMTLCNMTMEMGAKCALMPLDSESYTHLSSLLSEVPEGVWSDAGCIYEAEHEIDLSKIEPLVALPHDLTNIVPVREARNEQINMAFIGTCTNGRLSDLAEAAEILKKRRVHTDVRLVVTPGSRGVYLEAVRQGIVQTLIEAGAVLTTPGCGPCVGTHMGIPADGENVISTANRNFRGRMGNANASIFIASPVTVAASAVLGRIALQEELD